MSPLVVLALWVAWQNQPAEKCSISGTVVDSVTRQPLAKADVLLQPLNGKRDAVGATVSDADGKFSMTELDPGRYQLRAKRGRYLEMAYGARRPDGEGSVVQLEPGQAMTTIEIRLTPAAAIQGTVRESDGEPLEDALVTLARYKYGHGRPQLNAIDSAHTDDRGEYRFRGLAPGKYYIGVEPKSSEWNRIDRSAAVGPREESLPTFYPGVRDASMASPVAATAGRAAPGIDVTLLRSRVYRVAGRVLNAPPGRMTVTLHDAKSAVANYDLRTRTKNASGDFEFRDVPPGTYEMAAWHDSLCGSATVAVDASNVEDVRLTLAPGADVRLRVSAKGQDKPDSSRLDYFLTIDGKRGYGIVPFGSGDRLTAHNVPPGLYMLELGGALLREYYVAHARSGETDVLADGLRVAGPGLMEIEVVMARDGASAEGIVLDKDQSPVAGATVLLTPTVRSRLDLFRSTTTDQNGRYEFSLVPPGDYKLFAWDDVEAEAWNDPEFLAPYEDQGEKVALAPNGHVSKSLRLAAQP